MDGSSIDSRNIFGAGDCRALGVRKDLAARAEFGTDRRRIGRTARARGWTLALTSVVFSLAAGVGQAGPPVNFQGKLTTVPGIGPVLKTQKKDFPLVGKTSYLFHTLQDKRLLEREVRLDGVERADGTPGNSGHAYRAVRHFFCAVLPGPVDTLESRMLKRNDSLWGPLLP
ncbi:MAG: hypothetical protein DMG23_13505 [Acidobacteria bacterium]|nr:MAG: hypothetical protein DMG23_13505 [Acidobacteriota bacterium]